MRKIILLFIIMSFLVINTNTVLACSCARPGTPIKELKKATIVFSGKVKDIERFEYSYKIKFDIEESWKGISKIKKTVFIITGLGDGECGYLFENGEKYLVYAYGYADGNDYSLGTHICTRTKKLANAQEDLDELNSRFTPENDSNTESNSLVSSILIFILLLIVLIFIFKKYKK